MGMRRRILLDMNKPRPAKSTARNARREIAKREKQICAIRAEMMVSGATLTQLDVVAYLEREIEQWAQIRNDAEGAPVVGTDSLIY